MSGTKFLVKHRESHHKLMSKTFYVSEKLSEGASELFLKGFASKKKVSRFLTRNFYLGVINHFARELFVCLKIFATEKFCIRSVTQFF